MTLSKTVHLPVSGKSVKVNAFKISEEKILVLNKDNNDDLENILIDLIQSKTEDVSVMDLTIPDIVVLLINIIDISKGSLRHYKYKCRNKKENGEICGGISEFDVDLMNYTIEWEKADNIVKITDDITCELEHPSYRKIHDLEKYKDNESEYMVRFYASLIKAVYTSDGNVYTDFSDDEIYSWASDIPFSSVKKFNEFIASFPRLKVEYDVECPKCKSKEHYEVSSITDFFI